MPSYEFDVMQIMMDRLNGVSWEELAEQNNTSTEAISAAVIATLRLFSYWSGRPGAQPIIEGRVAQGLISENAAIQKRERILEGTIEELRKEVKDLRRRLQQHEDGRISVPRIIKELRRLDAEAKKRDDE